MQKERSGVTALYISSRTKHHQTTLPSGLEVTYRTPGPIEWVAVWRGLPTLRAMEGKQVETDAESKIARARDVVCRFSVTPAIVNKWPEDCEEDELSVLVMTDGDVAHLFKAIAGSIGVGDMQEVANDG